MLISQDKIRLLILSLVILVAVFFRFWHIRDYVVFLGDEGRDMIIMRDIFINKPLPFLGPSASVGGFYLGPIYYWMAAPFLLFWRFDPAGPAYFVAIIGTLTVILLYKFLKETAGFAPAILATLLYATAPLIVRYSRSSWNPNPLPFFSLLMIYLIYKGIKGKKNLFFIGAGACLGIAIQLHYLAVILFAIAGLIILVNANYKRWYKIAAFSIIGFLITFSPFLVFEVRHNFPNFRTILEFVTRGSTTGFKTAHFVWLISNFGNIFLEEISALKGTLLTKIAFWLISFSSIVGIFFYRKDREKKLIFSISIIWFFGGLLGLRFYTGQIFDYYFGFMFPAPFLLAGLIFSIIWQNRYLKFTAIIIMLFSTMYFIFNGFYREPPNRLIEQTEKISDFVIERSDNKPFNFALISDHNSDHAYRYFLELKKHAPIELETVITEQLIVICEAKDCSPLGNAIWEIAGFGRGEIAGEWELPQYGFKIFRLVHWPGAPSPAGKPAIKGG